MSRISTALDSVLRRVHDRAVNVAASVWFLYSLAGFLGAVILAVALDARLALPPAGLVMLDALLLVMAALPFVMIFRVRRGNPYRAETMALLIHEQLDLPSGRLINAVDFSIFAPPGASATLVDLAIRRGEDLAVSIDPTRVVDGAARRRPVCWVAIAAVACLLAALLAPGVFRAVGPRLFHPLSDLPPFTRLSFSVVIQPAVIHVGQDAVIRANVTGPELPLEASVVLSGAGGLKVRTPMWREISAPPAGAHPDDPLTEEMFSLQMENLSTAFVFYVDTPGGRSAWHRVEVCRDPLIERVTLSCQPPAYTGWKSERQTLGAGGIRALRRTRVAVQCRSNVALGGGLLELRPGKDAVTGQVSRIQLEVDPADTRSVTGSFEMAWSGSFVLGVTGADGLAGAKPISGPLHGIPDQPPEIAIVDPQPVSLAPEGWKVPVRIETSDDVGIAGVTAMTRVDNGKFVASILPADPAGQPASRTDVHTLDLSRLGARAGARIRYFALARDNEPEEGKTAETPVQTLLVVSMEEYRDIARAGYRMEDLKEEWEAFLARLDGLAKQRDRVLERLDELEKQRRERGGESPADRALMQELENALRSYDEELKDAADAMRKRTETLELYDVEQVYKEMLKTLAGQLDGQAEDAMTLERALAGVSDDGGAPPDFAKAAERFRANKKPFESRSMAGQLRGDLDKIDKAARLGFLASRLEAIIERQRDLADRLSSAKPEAGRDPDRPRLERLGAEQLSLEKELRATVDELQRMAEKCREALPRMWASADRLIGAVNRLAPWDDQAAAAKACPGEPETAAARSEMAAKKLESLLSECRGSGGEMGDELDTCLSLTRKQGMTSAQQMMQGMQMGLKMGMTGQGSMGGGFMGSMATVGMVGPRPPANSKSRSAVRGTDGPDGPTAGKGISSSGRPAKPADAIKVESSMENTTNARQIPGVPQAYRDLAEAYFRRLARDAVGTGHESKDEPGEERKE